MKRFTEFNFNHTKKMVSNNKINESEEKNVEQSDVSKFFSKLFESKEMAHIYHLQVKGDQGSFAKHEALGAYYEDILDMIDDLIEVYQGQYGLIENYDVIDTKNISNKTPEDYFIEISDFVMIEKKCIDEKDTHLHSLIDDVVCLLYKTLYKLKFLK